MNDVPGFADIERAGRRTAGRLRRTPAVRSDWLSAAAGSDVYLKLESLQVTGSFKPRGTLNAVLALRERLAPGDLAPRLVTASAGNHGRALAWAAQQVGLAVVVFTPRSAPAVKLEAITHLGAELHAEASGYDEAERMAKRFASETGALYISPYNDRDMIAGFGALGAEIADDLPDAARVVVPVGGGGLVAGIALALETLAPRVAVVGVEVEASHAFAASLAAGRIVEVEVHPTLADGLAGNMDAQNIAFPIVQRLIRRMLMVSEAELAAAIGGLAVQEHLIAEGAGATAAAAALAGRLGPADGPTVIVLSGGNIDRGRLKELL